LEKNVKIFVIRLSFFAWFFPVLVSHNRVAFIFNFGYLLYHSVCTIGAQSLGVSSCGASHGVKKKIEQKSDISFLTLFSFPGICEKISSFFFCVSKSAILMDFEKVLIKKGKVFFYAFISINE
jgi:hypothetical protein